MSSNSSFSNRLCIKKLGFSLETQYLSWTDKGSLFTPNAEMVCLIFCHLFPVFPGLNLEPVFVS